MKKLRVVLAIILVIVLLPGINVYAEDMIKGDKTPEEGCTENPPDFYDNDKEINYWHRAGDVLKEDQESIGEVKGSPTPEEGGQPLSEDAYKQDKMYYVPEGYIGYDIQLNVPMYMQKNIDFGGPASVEMILDYLLGPVNNQEIYAKDMGTDSNGTEIMEIEKTLNAYQDIYHFDKKSMDSKYHFVNCVMQALETNVPVIADISTTRQYKNGSWEYSMPGHYVVISGIKVTDDAKTYLTVLDPYLIGSTQVELSLFYEMLTDHWDSAIIY